MGLVEMTTLRLNASESSRSIVRMELSMLLAVLLGPILAVQAQKWLERARASRNRKRWIFDTLMATRAVRVSPEHVKALNMIDLAFYGRRLFSATYKTRREKQVVEAWREYLDHLNQIVAQGQLNDWTSRGEELFVNLLFAMSKDMDFDFDRVQLKRGIYYPRGHDELAFDHLAIRKLLVKVLSGERPLRMEVAPPTAPQHAAPAVITDSPPPQVLPDPAVHDKQMTDSGAQ